MGTCPAPVYNLILVHASYFRRNGEQASNREDSGEGGSEREEGESVDLGPPL